jgi:hypothetical protein
MPSSGHRPNRTALVIVKSIHSLIFALELASIGWLAVTGLTGRRDRSVVVATAAVAAEAVVFLANDRVCPLTPLAEDLGATDGAVSDIFLPDVVARTIPIWSTAMISLAAVLHLRHALRSRETGPRILTDAGAGSFRAV